MAENNHNPEHKHNREDDIDIVIPSDRSDDNFDYSRFYLEKLRFYSFLYQNLVDNYKSKTTNIYLLVKLTSLLSTIISLISVFSNSINTYLSISTSIVSLVITVIIELLQRIYPQSELTEYSKYLKMIDFRLGKIESLPPEVRLATLKKNIHKMSKLLSEAPSMSIKDLDKGRKLYVEFNKGNLEHLNKDDESHV